MPIFVDIKDSSLMLYLKKKNEGYYAKVLELRAEIQRWLSQIPNTFPHYTSHTIEHSEEIIRQLSSLLFSSSQSTCKPSVELSPTEIYILIAAAYLHDAGMVVSDKEKQAIFNDPEWQEWTSEGGGAKRWKDISEFRNSNLPSEEQKHFIADRQIRFLIAEYMRIRHHIRSGDVIQQHQSALGRFAYDNMILRDTIADVCIAHGLSQIELENDEKYPEQRDIQGDKVNVRFLAILLRLGDLLDMSHDRACPLILNTASPLPTDSLAHWTQYHCITHRVTSPAKIEITAKCNTQDEHRLLKDWCQWIVNEVNNSAVIMGRALRHTNWKAPVAKINGTRPTIIITPSEKAIYIPSEWNLILNEDLIYERLIYDTYGNSNAFLYELLQNSMDAMRCQVNLDLNKQNQDIPSSLTELRPEILEKYTLRIMLRDEVTINEFSGEKEIKQILTIDDCGIGMDKHIIGRYFLQIGQSYYTSPEFRQNFKFKPTSKFGIGFLSVFAVSDYIVIETFKACSTDGAIRLTLRGPRNYLLTEQSSRKKNGTRIDITLLKPFKEGNLRQLLEDCCKRLEFSIEVNELGKTYTIRSEVPERFLSEVPILSEEGKFSIKAFPFKEPDIEGEFYIFSHITAKGESWIMHDWAKNEYPKMHPNANVPNLPGNLFCLHGIKLVEHSPWQLFPTNGISFRLDYRGSSRVSTLSRTNATDNFYQLIFDKLKLHLEKILKKHFNTSEYAKGLEGWKYKQKFFSKHRIMRSFDLHHLPKTFIVYKQQLKRLMSLQQIQKISCLKLIADEKKILYHNFKYSDLPRPIVETNCNSYFILHEDIEELSISYTNRLFDKRSANNVRWLKTGQIEIDLVKTNDNNQPFYVLDTYREIKFFILSIDPIINKCPSIVMLNIDNLIILNKKHPFTIWLKNFKTLAESEQHNVDFKKFSRVLSMLLDATNHILTEKLETLNKFISNWNLINKCLPAPTLSLSDFWLSKSKYIKHEG
jgi:molecular chaperone HtpG